MKSTHHECPICKAPEELLTYEGELGYPGVGYVYKCHSCGNELYKRGMAFYSFANMNPEDVELDPADCI